MSLSLATGSKRHALSERGHDLYQTPREAVLALLGVERVPCNVWEPACGPGAIASVLRERGHSVMATDLVDYASPHQDKAGIDFLKPCTAVQFPRHDRAIVTNPPFKDAHLFVTRALELAPYVAMLLRLAFLESEKRRDILDQSCLARVHVFRKRLPMMHREGWEGPKASSATAFAWFIWERTYKGPPQLHRVSWEEFA